MLVDLEHDIRETTDLSADHPDVVERLLALADRARDELGDFNRKGNRHRPAGLVVTPKPLLLSTD